MTDPKRITDGIDPWTDEDIQWRRRQRCDLRWLATYDAQAEQIATLTKDLASAKARCERMEKALRRAAAFVDHCADTDALRKRAMLMGAMALANISREAITVKPDIDAALADETSADRSEETP